MSCPTFQVHKAHLWIWEVSVLNITTLCYAPFRDNGLAGWQICHTLAFFQGSLMIPQDALEERGEVHYIVYLLFHVFGIQFLDM